MKTSDGRMAFRLGLLVLTAFSLGAYAQDSPRAEVKQSVAHAKTAPLRDFAPYSQGGENAPVKVFPVRTPKSHGGGGGGAGGGGWSDPAKQTSYPALQAKLGVSIPALTSVGYVPPDPNLAVGATQVVAIDNVDFAVYDKSGSVQRAQAPIHSIFGALGSGNLCATTDGGDPIVLFDKIDQRWLIAQLAYNSGLNDDHECIAISDTSDATGSYQVYDMSFGSNLPDYPKFGIWSDGGSKAGVYFSANIFASGNSFSGAEFCAFPLSDMATPPATLTWVCTGPVGSAYNVLPADQEGGTNGEVGSALPELYFQFVDNLNSSSGNELYKYTYNVNFTAQTASLSAPTTISVNTFHEACGGGACVPQLNTREKLDSLGDRLMYRASFRHYGSSDERLLLNHSVQISSSSNQTGMRWYQINSPNSTYPTVAQQSTYAPDTSNYRWMGSIAQDKAGDLGAGYSMSSSSAYVGIAFTGQEANTDPLNQLEQEQVVTVSKGAQKSVNRWGDYSAISLDPADDCTFWYTNEILTGTGSYTNWETYITNFKFPSCGQ